MENGRYAIDNKHLEARYGWKCNCDSEVDAHSLAEREPYLHPSL
jgi:hypothetical protein